MNAADIARIATARAGCCLCPSTGADLGDGIGPAAALHAGGVALSIGTDSHAVIDGFGESRSVETGARLATEERGLLSAEELLQAATLNGMDALGWDAGALEVGKLADFVTVNLDSPRLAGVPPGPLAVFAATAADVTTVVVGGRQTVGSGRHLAFDVAAELQASVAAVLGADSR